jgi:drug/metabolite transporter (DMT)-like permease
MPPIRAGRARLYLLGAALLFSTGGAAIKSTQFSNWQVACFRSGIAAAVVLLVMPESRRKWDLRVFGAAVAYALTLILFVTSNKLTTAANAIFLQSTSPLYLVFLGPWILKERVRPIDLVALVAIAAGMALFFLDPSTRTATAPDPSAGNIIAVCSGTAWAITLVSLRWMEKTTHEEGRGLAVVAVGNLIAFLACAPMAFPVQTAATADWLTIIYLGVFQIGLAYVLLTKGVRGTEAFATSLLLMVETALNPVWSYLVHGEKPGRFALAGASVIMVATIAWQYKKARA